MEENDEELWDDLIRASLDKPKFIKGLLDNVGTHINPIQLIKRPELRGLQIEGLQGSLVKILQDFNLQIELRKGCTTILTNDCIQGLHKLNRLQKMGLAVKSSCMCTVCNTPIAMAAGTPAKVVVFHCSHVYHLACIESQLAGRAPHAAEAVGGVERRSVVCSLCRSANESVERVKVRRGRKLAGPGVD
jgi:hypothetical protein